MKHFGPTVQHVFLDMPLHFLFLHLLLEQGGTQTLQRLSWRLKRAQDGVLKSVLCAAQPEGTRWALHIALQ